MKPCPGLPTIQCRGVCFACDSCACGCKCADVETKKPGTHLIGVEWEDEKLALRYNAEGLLPCVFCGLSQVTLITEQFECYVKCPRCDARGCRVIKHSDPDVSTPARLTLTASERAKIAWNRAHHEDTVA